MYDASAPPLLVEKHDAVLILSLNRPARRNALDRPLLQALAHELAHAAAEREVRAIVLTGSGESFCSGADLRSVVEAGDDLVATFDDRMDEFHAVIRAIASTPKPVVAAVDGPAVGFGCDLALACDLRVLSTRAVLQEKFVQIGLMPDGGGTFFLPRLIGLGRAMELILTGAPIDAARAESLGLASRVVAPERLRAEALDLAQTLAEGPPIALAEAKRAVLASGLDDALAREKKGQRRCIASADAAEGVMAFLGKRKPIFRGE
jgi:enoyl-CoA hydratase/carnithine racemase